MKHRAVSTVLWVTLTCVPNITWGLARLADPTFGNGGLATASFCPDCWGYAYGLALQPDGRLVVAGSVSSGWTGFGPPRAEPPTAGFGLARFTTDGTLDLSFGSGGTVQTMIFGWVGALAVAVQPDGKIVAVGSAGDPTRTSPKGNTFSYIAMARYNPDGSLDATFGAGGTVTAFVEPYGAEGCAAVLQPDGKLIVGGRAHDDQAMLARFNPDGSFDATFGAGGTVVDGYSSIVLSVGLASDGKIVAASGGALVRYNTDGSLDDTFGTGGKVFTDFGKVYLGPFTSRSALSLLIQPDGKLVTAGELYWYPPGCNVGEDFLLMRYNDDGTPDLNFGSSGDALTSVLGCGAGIARASVLQPDGKIIAGGGGDVTLVRYNPDGSLDPSFGINGILQNSGAEVGSVNALVRQPDNNVVSAGQWWEESTNGSKKTVFALTRYALKCGNGNLDPGEECDDGNLINGDGCDANCTLPACGNGVLDPGEQCDDGNLVNGDGCEADCTLPFCGNGIRDAGEQCDDGNNIDGDGCEADCTIPRCGNGILDPPEECDDGNRVDGDGCSGICTIEHISGGGAKTADCLMEWSVSSASSGPASLSAKQSCQDNDATCDFDGGVFGSCTFHVSLCPGANDRRLRWCTPDTLATIEVLTPSRRDAARSAVAATNRATLESVAQAMLSAPIGTCSSPVEIIVPRPTRGTQAGKLVVKTRTRSAGGMRDSDKLTLICRP